MLARVPADAAAERVAGDAHVRRGAVQGGKAELRRGGNDVPPLGARPHAADAPVDVELDALQRVGLDEDHVVHGAERLRVVAGALRRDLQAVRARVLDDRDDVLLVRRDCDELRLLYEGGVERLRGSVPTRIAGLDDGALETPLQGVARIGGDDGHDSLFLTRSRVVGCCLFVV